MKDIPLQSRFRDDRLICTKCGTVMDDSEPCWRGGEFWHKPTFKDGTKNKCQNAGKTFSMEQVGTKKAPGIEVFLRKKTRRNANRLRRSVRS